MQSNFLNIVTLLIPVIALPVTLIAMNQQQTFQQQAQVGAQVFLVPSSKGVTSGQLLAVAVDVHTGEDVVNTVQLDLRYPSDKLDVTEVDTTNSAFSSETEYVAGNGLIRMGREATIPVEGQKHIATVRFSAKDTVSEQEVKQISGNASFKTLNNTSIQTNTTHISNVSEIPDPTPKRLGIWESLVLFFQNLNPLK